MAQANAAVIEQIRRARPHWLDVKPASSLISVLNQGKTLLHAGPPMRWQEMTGPMKGACIGACLFEGWAKDEMSALALLEQGKVNFIPCHHVNAVGPMGGITSASMPMLVVENITDGNRAYCNLNEGIGKVMRFGAYGEDVQQRLRWMRDVLMPVLSAALGRLERGLDLTAMMAQGITMGDEFHQRNIASSALLMRTLAPHIARLQHDKQQIAEVMDFLSVTDQFFLNLAMAYCKAAMDAGAQIRAGSIVTAMTRNGDMFGIRVSGLGDRWFTAPVNTPQGLFFTGFSQDQANPDMGDSAITETFGIGGAAMIAAPGVTRFVGAGDWSDWRGNRPCAAGLFRAGAGSAGGKHGRKLRERLMKRIHPLMASRQSADYRQPWQMSGVWRRSINFVAKSGELLTLHRRGSGFSPGGWILRGGDFDALRDVLTDGEKPQLTAAGIQIGEFLLCEPERRCSLRVPRYLASPRLNATYMQRSEETGLFGPLTVAAAQPLCPELRQFCHCFQSALAGAATDWRLWLGKGPGLTPSHEDTLTGMLLAAWYFGAIDERAGRNFFAQSGSLDRATTLVSVSYLRYAAMGYFASPLLHFIHALRRDARTETAIDGLLALGHTSGADTLLGFWLGQQIVKG
ncbi:Protein of uncharacterised function (DUF1116) [Salmonella enterica subsp. enterica serovar Typhi]|nr:Protein of uncharacterised function (DUF1116) [Salmonella enterica subsp. enterica serovar Typhi]CHP61866.1 Protein of uncharacterised function (DUF1116) [Salmonella enterica subsp. enterica serovar Typhi]CRJ54671.1 Protein of uncharacterised function (DUF1116) [Salmonella enterica subsp. enterica serovar Typhi]